MAFCCTVTGSICTDDVKLVNIEEKEAVVDNCLKEDESPKETFADGSFGK